MGRHFLQIPGPTNVPGSVLRAMSAPTIDHRGPEFQALCTHALQAIRPVFGTVNPVIIYPATGTGAWEAALVNTLSPGDRVLYAETGHFSTLWQEMAQRLGLEIDVIPGDWRHGASPHRIAERLSADTDRTINAICVVHNETSTGVTSRIADIRRAIDASGHPALFLVDAISSLGSVDYRHDEWKVDVTVAGSQKGLMLPPGLSFNAISDKAIAASKLAGLPRSFWDWGPILDANEQGFTPYTPATNMFYALKESLRLLDAEGLDAAFARHTRHAEATRAAVEAWGLEVVCLDDREHSASLTAVMVPEGHDADKVREIILDRYNMSLGAGLTKLAGQVFRIGHLGEFDDLSLVATLAGVEMGLNLSGVSVNSNGINAALERLQRP